MRAAARRIGFGSISSYIGQQSRNFRTLLVRDALGRFSSIVTETYRSPFMVRGLGATVGEYGFARSIVSLVSALSSIPAAMVTDRYPMKKLILLSLVLDMLVPLAYLVTVNWQTAALAWIFESVVLKLSGPPLQVIYIASLKDRDRATGMGVSATVRSVVGIISPMVAAVLVSYCGGLTVEGIRPVFLVALFVLVANIVLLWRRLEEIDIERSANPFSLRHFAEVFRGDEALRRYTVMESMREFVINVVNPYAILYAVLVKGADAYTLGLMSIAELLPMILFAVPLGRLSDKIGRKKTVYLFRPVRYAADIGLILAPNASWLPLVQFIRGFRLVSQEVSWTAFTHELVPINNRIRYVAVTTLVNGIGAFAAALLGSFLWENVWPESLFIFVTVFDACVVMPLFARIPERRKLDQ